MLSHFEIRLAVNDLIDFEATIIQGLIWLAFANPERLEVYAYDPIVLWLGNVSDHNSISQWKPWYYTKK